MQQTVLNHLLKTYYAEKFSLTQNQIDTLTTTEQPANPPQNREIAHTMHDLGIAREEICRYLNITPQGLWNHLSRPERPYPYTK